MGIKGKDVMEEEHDFYGKPIFRGSEQQYIQHLLSPFVKEVADEELLKKVWDFLQKEKQLGRITIPFKVVLRRDPVGKYPDVVEVILDTKV